MSLDRRRIRYRGRVQGVGFRATTRRIASLFAIKGYVRNLNDGRVEIYVEGAARDVESFLGTVRREIGDLIQEIDVEFEPSNVECLDGFQVRY